MKLFLTLAALAALATVASAQGDQIDTFEARLSAQDHKSSTGKKLTNAAAIIRRDRANYNRFNKRDSEDTDDGLFKEESGRINLEKLVQGALTAAQRKKIVNGTPLIQVTVFVSTNKAQVKILSD